MAILLVVTGYLNITLNSGIDDVSTNLNTETQQGSFFSTYRTDRELTRSQELLYLDAILSSQTSSADAKAVAENKKVELVKTMELELVIEGLIKAKGFDDVIVTNTTSNVNVIVKSTELSTSEVAQIVSIIQEQTG